MQDRWSTLMGIVLGYSVFKWVSWSSWAVLIVHHAVLCGVQCHGCCQGSLQGLVELDTANLLDLGLV
eukprot:8336821-Ditylum_brightwellii.AAC.1